MTVNAGKEEHTDVVDQFKKWKNLKKASFSYNELHSIDYSIVRNRNVYTDWYFYKKLVKELNREIGHTFVRNHCWLSQVFYFSKNQGKPYYPRNEKNDNAEGISGLDSYFFYTISFFFSGPYFPAFGLNMARYGVSLRIQSQCGKIPTRKNSVFGHFSRSGNHYVSREKK